MSRLLLLPNSLAEEISPDFFSPEIHQAIAQVDGMIVESEKRARRFLKCFSFSNGRTFREIPLRLLNEHTSDLSELIASLKKGETWGLISDGGLPCLADPGAKLVAQARKESIAIEVFPGASSMIYTLMLSGLPAQSFAFHGYFPKEETLRKKFLAELLARSKKERAPQIFIEAPYRSHHRLRELIELLPEQAHLAIGYDLMEPTQEVISSSVRKWREKELPDIKKRPAVFILFQSL